MIWVLLIGFLRDLMLFLFLLDIHTNVFNLDFTFVQDFLLIVKTKSLRWWIWLFLVFLFLIIFSLLIFLDVLLKSSFYSHSFLNVVELLFNNFILISRHGSISSFHFFCFLLAFRLIVVHVLWNETQQNGQEQVKKHNVAENNDSYEIERGSETILINELSQDGIPIFSR